MRAPSNGRVLNAADAALVKGMINRGDRQHDIAPVFAVNGGRIGEASTGAKFNSVAPATTGLPPAAPYLVVPANLRKIAKGLRKDMLSLGAPATVIASIDLIIDSFDSSHALRRGK